MSVTFTRRHGGVDKGFPPYRPYHSDLGSVFYPRWSPLGLSFSSPLVCRLEMWRFLREVLVWSICHDHFLVLFVFRRFVMPCGGCHCRDLRGALGTTSLPEVLLTSVSSLSLTIFFFFKLTCPVCTYLYLSTCTYLL